MPICPSCGRESPPDAAFCARCGTSLEALRPPGLEERKVVTVLFADLVGSTAQAESHDPEEVRSILTAYYARLRVELERHGGTVEKFIGDAVMAVFGAPVAHEDDPERAVRAALAIREALAESAVDVRIAVHTGEALVALGARVAAGEAMVAGDVVNTAARLQTGAPVNGILVGRRPTVRPSMRSATGHLLRSPRRGSRSPYRPGRRSKQRRESESTSSAACSQAWSDGRTRSRSSGAHWTACGASGSHSS